MLRPRGTRSPWDPLSDRRFLKMLVHFIKIAYREGYTKAPTDRFAIRVYAYLDPEGICGVPCITLPDSDLLKMR